MKTRNKLILGILSGTFLFAGCAKNELPTFKPSDSFIAFTSTDINLAENGNKPVSIEVLCSSLYGIDASVEFEIVPREVKVDTTIVKVEDPETGGYKDSTVITRTDKGAKNGINFTYSTSCLDDYITDDSAKLVFAKNRNSAKIIIYPIDNGIFTGDLFFSVNLKNVEGANLGASNSCQVTVADDEHPLAFMLGSFTGKGDSYFNGETTWNLTITKDPDGDLNKVWFYPFVPNNHASAKPVYGIVNDEKTEVKIPVRQIFVAWSDGAHAYLDGFRDLYNDDDVIPEGEFLNATISADATIKIADVFGSQVVEADGSGSGWYNIMMNGVTLTKK